MLFLPGTLAWVEVERLCRQSCSTVWVDRLTLQSRPVAQRPGLRRGGFPSAMQHALQCIASSEAVVPATGPGNPAWGRSLLTAGGAAEMSFTSGRIPSSAGPASCPEWRWAVLCSVVRASRPSILGFAAYPAKAELTTVLHLSLQLKLAGCQHRACQAALPGSTACGFETDLLDRPVR